MNVRIERASGLPTNSWIKLRRAAGWIGALPFLAMAAGSVYGTTVLDPLPEKSTTQFGYAAVAIGDVNGDGVPDLAVGAPFQDGDFVSNDAGYGKPQNVGKVFILDGANLSLLNTLNDPQFEKIQPDHFGGLLGNSLAAVADLNGDGVAEIVAGVPHHIVNPHATNEVINGGEVFVFSGKDGAVLFTLLDPAPQEDGKMGAAVAGLGDVDGDGFADMVVGVPGEDLGDEEDGVSNVGLAYVFSGKSGQVIRTLSNPDATAAGAAFGSAVANAGDVDRDGVTDILVGAPGAGHVFVFSGKTGTVLFDIASPVTDDLASFGSAVSGGKDFNRDGKPDFVVGAPLQKNLRGAAYIFSGSNGALLRSLRARPGQDYSKFGASVLATDDVTGDRQPDVLVGAPDRNVSGVNHAGEVFVFDGRGKLSQSLTSANPQSDAHYGATLTEADFDRNGVATAVVGTPDADANLDATDHLQIGQIEIQ
ncbi:MAG TPA: integrin alpha [Chthoniobacterales bacterium]|jgi:hypothetical protein